MARPTKFDKRDRQFNVALTSREHDLLLERATRSGMRLVDYGREQLLAGTRATAPEAAPPPHLDPLFQVALSRLGNNLNQIAREMHRFGHPAPPSLEPLLGQIRALIARRAAVGS